MFWSISFYSPRWSGVYGNTRLKSDYMKLYISTIQKLVKDNDPTRPYLTSSPSNGLASTMEGGLSSDPGDTRYGDSKLLNKLLFMEWR